MDNKLKISLKGTPTPNPVVQSLPSDLSELGNRDVRSEFVACLEKAVQREFDLTDMNFEVKRGEGDWEFVTMSLLLLQLSKQGNLQAPTRAQFFQVLYLTSFPPT